MMTHQNSRFCLAALILLCIGLWAGTANAALVLHYDMNEASGNLINSVNGQTMGTINGGAVRVADPFGGTALSFDGIDDYVYTPEWPVLTSMQDAGSMEFWYYRPSGSPRGPYMAFSTQTGSYESMRAAVIQRPVDSDPDPANVDIMAITGGGPLGGYDVNYGHPDASVPQYDHWNHIAMTWGDGNVQLYLNGVFLSQGGGQPANIDDGGGDGSAQFYIGYLVGFSQQYFKGAIDEVSMWNNKLSAADVLNDYNAGLAAMVPVTVPGDFDGNGVVNGVDFATWQTSFPLTSGATLGTGDADGDGDVDGADFIVWQTHYTGSSAVTTVPEPASACIAVVSSAFAVAGRCLRRKLGYQ